MDRIAPLIAATMIALSGLLDSPSARAGSCLDEAAKFAERICGDIANSGTETLVDANGNLDANVSSIVRRIIGGGNASVNGGVLYQAYIGVLREQLAGAQFTVLECRQKMAQSAINQVCSPATKSQPANHSNIEKPSKPKYSYFANAPYLLEKDISMFQNIPKVSDKDGLMGVVNNYTENIIVDGKNKLMYVTLYFIFKKGNYLKHLTILAEDGGEDCEHTEVFKIISALNANMWGQYRHVGDSDVPLGADDVKSISFSYCGKDHTYLRFNVVWSKNPTHIYNNAPYLCEYYNYYDKNYDDLFSRCL